MDLMFQIVSQMMNGFAQIPSAPAQDSSTSDTGTTFDSMVQDRQQQADDTKTQEQPKSTAKQESTKQQTATKEETPVQDAKQQYEMAAAILAQMQPVVYSTEQPQAELQAAVAAAVVPAAADGPAVVTPQEFGETTVETSGLTEAPVELVAAPDGTEEIIPVTDTQPTFEASVQPQLQQKAPEVTPETVPEPQIVQQPVDEAPVPEQQTFAEASVKAETPQQQPVQTAEQPTEAPQLPQQTAPKAEAPAAPMQQTEQTDLPQQVVPEGNIQTVEAKPVVKQPEVLPQADDVTEEENVPTETPVFGEVKATPVKVAEAPSEPVRLEAKDAPEQLSEKLVQPLLDGSSRVELTLTPEHLGKITVEITRAQDGSLSVILSASTQKAASLLDQHGNQLQQLLAADTHADVKVQVQHAEQQNQQQFLNPNDSNGQQQQQRQQQQEQKHPAAAQDFMQQLRLGLIDLDTAAS